MYVLVFDTTVDQIEQQKVNKGVQYFFKIICW